ncbi:hypothetical protein TNCV_1942471, partial [Trichonephila clavipes]
MRLSLTWNWPSVLSPRGFPTNNLESYAASVDRPAGFDCSPYELF